MDEKEKQAFLNVLIDNVKQDILKQVPHMPEDWDGVELRWFVRDAFNGVVFGGFNNKRGKRWRDFDNYCLSHNLYS